MGAHRAELRVRFYELDPYGHVNHATYVQYFEAARVEMLHEIGHGLDHLHARGEMLVVSRIHTRFLASARLHDLLTVETGLLSCGRVSAQWGQRIHRGDEMVATQLVEVAGLDASGQISRFSAELVAALDPYAVPADWFGRYGPT